MKSIRFLLLFILCFCTNTASVVWAKSLRTVALSDALAPDTNGVFSVLGRAVLNDSGQTAFRAGIDGLGIDENNDSGIWSEGSGNLSLVAREGAPAPGTTRSFRNFLIPFDDLLLNDAGQIVFSGSVPDLDFPAAGNSGIWSEAGSSLALVALADEIAPGTSEVYLNGFDFTQNNHGHVVFRAGLLGTTITAPGEGIWANRTDSLSPIILERDAAPGTASTFLSLGDPVYNDLGNIAFSGRINRSGNSRGIWAEQSGVLNLIAFEGEPAPGTSGSFSEFGRGSSGDLNPVINDAGDIAFFATLTGSTIDSSNDSGIWATRGGTLAAVAIEGVDAPGTTASFSELDREAPLINGRGETAFLGRLTGPGVDTSNNRGIWSESGGSLSLVARSGDTAPGTSANFRAFFDLSFNGKGQTAFRANVTGSGIDGTNSQGIWAENKSGDLVLIARRGDRLDVDDGPGTDFRTIFDLSFAGETGNQDGRASGFNELGQLAFSVSFTDGSAGVFVSDLAAVPEPSALILVAVGALIAFSQNQRLFNHGHD